MNLYNPITIRPQDFAPSMYASMYGKQMAQIILPFLQDGRPVIFDYKETEQSMLILRIRPAPLFYNALMAELLKYFPLQYLENMIRYINLTEFYKDFVDVLQHW